MPLSDELWRPISWSCLGGLARGRLPPPWPEGRGFSAVCDATLAPALLAFSGWFEGDSFQIVSRLPTLQSDWLVSDVSEEPDMLRSSPPADGQYDASRGVQQTSRPVEIKNSWVVVSDGSTCAAPVGQHAQPLLQLQGLVVQPLLRTGLAGAGVCWGENLCRLSANFTPVRSPRHGRICSTTETHPAASHKQDLKQMLLSRKTARWAALWQQGWLMAGGSVWQRHDAYKWLSCTLALNPCCCPRSFTLQGRLQRLARNPDVLSHLLESELRFSAQPKSNNFFVIFCLRSGVSGYTLEPTFHIPNFQRK